MSYTIKPFPFAYLSGLILGHLLSLSGLASASILTMYISTAYKNFTPTITTSINLTVS